MEEPFNEPTNRPLQKPSASFLVALLLEAMVAITAVLTMTQFPIASMSVVDGNVTVEPKDSYYGVLGLYMKKLKIQRTCETSECETWLNNFASVDNSKYS
eukprot:Blabericola_migrator_1__6449@NODE_3253_length_1908_cov_158_485606_g2035_i0_p3_GENE_NODE_3253_length_1908_cov_158_485606_g2035_i0NODE_3253_length_1908_cov_158_485606_g2035_i0_p3_ORF_typecomplete_len100_score16_11PT/PF04886_12/0_028p6/PF17548_2/0_054_NODE_3253_length_1908_cov_158_485606_g2035_i0660959